MSFCNSNFRRNYFFLLLTLIIVSVCWAFYGRIDIVTIAPGVVVPSSKIKNIQHLEGGIIRSINVREGEKVKKNTNLIELEMIISGASLKETEVRLLRLQIDLSRLYAEIMGNNDIAINDEIRSNYPELISSSRELFKTRSRHLKNLLNVQGLHVLQIEQGINEINERISKNKKFLSIIEERIEISNDLLKENLTNRMQHLILVQQEIEHSGKIREDIWAVKKANSEREEALVRKENIRDNYQTKIRLEFDEKEASFRELKQRKNKIEDSLKRSIIRAPVDGKIKFLYQTTTGGIIKPGETILDLVPDDDRLVVEAKLRVDEVVYVNLEHEVKVQLITQNQSGSSQILGNVIYISPDSITKTGEIPFYLIRIKLNKNYFEEDGKFYQLLPGMQVVCNILTGSRSIMGYLINPFFNIFDRALRER